MRNLGIHAVALAGGLVFGTAALADGMSHSEYELQEKSIKAEYQAAKARCEPLAGNAKEVCVAEARGNASVAKAGM
jgi:hypothetical protein